MGLFLKCGRMLILFRVQLRGVVEGSTDTFGNSIPPCLDRILGAWQSLLTPYIFERSLILELDMLTERTKGARFQNFPVTQNPEPPLAGPDRD